MLNARGGIECDLTVPRVGSGNFYIVTGTGFRTHDFDWIRRNLPAGLEAEIVDVTEDYGCLCPHGAARARRADGGHRHGCLERGLSFRLRAARSRSPARGLRALRITYVGELGWELHVPIDGVSASTRR